MASQPAPNPTPAPDACTAGADSQQSTDNNLDFSSGSDSDEGMSGLTLFELIKQGKHSTAVHRIRRGGCDLEQPEAATGWSPLLTAAYYGSERVAAALLKAGVSVHATTPTGETALHLACKWPHEKVVEVLVKHGANPNALNKRARSPAHTSAIFARRGNLELIIGAGGDISLQDADGNTPLHLAVKGSGPGPNEVMRMLLRGKCRLDLPNKAGELPLHHVANTQALVLFAAMEGLPDLTAALIKKGGVKLDVFDNSGMTPLQTAAFKGDVAVARALLAGGAKVNFQASPSWSPCPSLAAADSLLVGHGPSSNVKPLGDRSALHFAAERGIIPMMELLLAHGAKVNNTSNEGLISPLHIAVWNQQAEAVRVLLAHKADVKARVNKNGMAPLHFACNARNAKLEIISMLLDAKADIEERCSDGLTPLMLAAQMATPDAVRLLLVRGARVQAKGRRGMTAVDCAEGRANILQVLAQHCAARGLTEMASKATAGAQRAARLAAKAAAATPALTVGGEGPSTSSAPAAHDATAQVVQSVRELRAQAALPAPPGSSAGGSRSGAGSSSSSSSLAVDAGSAGGLLGQLKQQLSSTSAQLCAWAAAANARTGTGASGSGSSTAAGLLGSGLPDVDNNGPLQQLLGQMGLPTSLADIGSSPLSTPANSSGVGNLPLLDAANGGAAAPAGSTANMNALSEAVQMLSCITAIVTNQQADAAGPAPPRAGSSSRRDSKAVSRKRSAGAAAAAAGSSSSTAATVTDVSTCSTQADDSSASSSTALVAAPPSASTASTAAAPAPAAAPAGPPPPPAPAGVCALHQPRTLPRSLRCPSCSLAPVDGVVQASEHHLQLSCTAGCHLVFHLPCWKAVREQLRVARPGFPSTFTQVTEPMECIAKDCQGTINQVCMVGPAGTQVLYQPPPKPATTIKAELVLRPAPLSATVPLAPVSTVQYTFVTEKPPSPPPAPAPVVLLPPADGAPLVPTVSLPPSAGPAGARSDSPPVPPGTGDDAHLMRRKRRGPREPAAPPLGPESGEALQGRNPPVPVTGEHGPAPTADPLAYMRMAPLPGTAAPASWDDPQGGGSQQLKAGAMDLAQKQQSLEVGNAAREPQVQPDFGHLGGLPHPARRGEVSGRVRVGRVGVTYGDPVV